MAVKGNFSALQQQRESNVDFTKGILDATNIYLKMQENRRAEEEHVERKDLYKQKKDELLRNAINGEMDAIDKMFQLTGYQGPDQAITTYFLNQKEKIGNIINKYPDWQTNPQARNEINRLNASAKYLGQTAGKIKSTIEDLNNGMQWTVNSKGEKIPPKYSKTAGLELKKYESILTGDYIIEDYNGVPLYFYKGVDGGKSGYIDTNILNKNGVTGHDRFDYDEWFKEKSKVLGSIKTVKDKGNRTISTSKFDDIVPSLKADVKNMIGSDYKNLTDIGKSILVDAFSYDVDKLDEYDESTHEKLINTVVENFRSTYKEEVKDEANVQLINANESERHNKQQEAIGWKNAKTAEKNAETNAKKVNHDIKQDTQNSGGYQYVKFAGNNGVTYPLKKGFEVEGDEGTIKANSMIVTNDNGVMRYYASDGGPYAVEVNNSQKLLNEAGVSAQNVMDALNSKNINNNNPEKSKGSLNP